jgi:hypothetical protein
MEDKDLQFTLGIERAVLSSILFNPELIEIVKKEILPQTFYLHTHQDIYQAMLNLEKNDMPIDEDFVQKEILSDNFKSYNLHNNLFQKGEIETALVEVLSANASANIKAYFKQMQEAHTKREIHNLTLHLQANKLNIAEFKRKLTQIENLYTDEIKLTAQEVLIDYKKLTPFLSKIVQDLVKINSYPPSMVLSTVLTAMAGVIGARAKISNGVNITVFPVIWSMIVAPSSVSAKSTLFRYTKKCIFDDMQSELFDKYEVDLESYKDDLKKFNALAKEDKMREIEPERPRPKLLIFASDGTPEAKIVSLSNNQNGGVVFFDEMKSELEKSNNDPRYKALKTSIFDGELYHKELVKDGGTFILRNPVLSEVGLITEQWLLESVQKNDIASGFMARYLFSYNTRADFKPLQINKFFLNNAEYSDVGKFIIEMLDIDRKEPLEYVFELQAREYYIKWFNDFSKTAFATETDEEITASYRLSTYVLKFTLILYIFDTAYNKIDTVKNDKFAIPLKYVKAAIYLMELFQEENHKILNLFEKHKKLNFKIDDTLIKLQKKIQASEHKRITRSQATNGIRGLTASRLNELINQGLFVQEIIDKTKYIKQR